LRKKLILNIQHRTLNNKPKTGDDRHTDLGRFINYRAAREFRRHEEIAALAMDQDKKRKRHFTKSKRAREKTSAFLMNPSTWILHLLLINSFTLCYTDCVFGLCRIAAAACCALTTTNVNSVSSSCLGAFVAKSFYCNPESCLQQQVLCM